MRNKINLTWLGFVVALTYWLLEAILQAWYWETGPISGTILAQSQDDELSMRLVTVVLMIGLGYFAQGVKQQLLQKNKQQEKISRLLRLLSDCNQHVQRKLDEPSLLNAACKSVVDIGGFRFAWIGMKQGAGFNLAAWASSDAAIAEEVVKLQEFTPLIRCSGCQIVKDGVAELCELNAKVGCTAPWLPAFLEKGCVHAIVLPLKVDGKTMGVFEIYAEEDVLISNAETTLLEEVADDVSTALKNIAVEAERKQAAKELAKRVDELKRFQRASIDRESRIKELRNENVELQRLLAESQGRHSNG